VVNVKQQATLFAADEPEDIGDDLDYYETPEWCWDAVAPIVRAALDRMPRSYLIEPAAGRGALLGYVLHSVEVCAAQAIELHPKRFRQLRAQWEALATCRQGDFLSMQIDAPVKNRRALVVLNPPYSKPRKTIGQEFVERSLKLATPKGIVVALLPLAFAAGQGRAALHQRYASSIYVLSERPGFGGEHDTGSKDYAWFVWDLAHPKREWGALVRP